MSNTAINEKMSRKQNESDDIDIDDMAMKELTLQTYLSEYYYILKVSTAIMFLKMFTSDHLTTVINQMLEKNKHNSSSFYNLISDLITSTLFFVVSWLSDSYIGPRLALLIVNTVEIGILLLLIWVAHYSHLGEVQTGILFALEPFGKFSKLCSLYVIVIVMHELLTFKLLKKTEIATLVLLMTMIGTSLLAHILFKCGLIHVSHVIHILSQIAVNLVLHFFLIMFFKKLKKPVVLRYVVEKVLRCYAIGLKEGYARFILWRFRKKEAKRLHVQSSTLINVIARKSRDSLLLFMLLIIPRTANRLIATSWKELIILSEKITTVNYLDYAEIVHYGLVIINFPVAYYVLPEVTKLLKKKMNLKHVIGLYQLLLIFHLLFVWSISKYTTTISQYPGGGTARITFYNGMSTSTNIHTKFTHREELRAGAVLGRNTLYNNKERVTKAIITTSLYKYNKTIVIGEKLSISYVITDIGCIKITRPDPVQLAPLPMWKDGAKILFVNALKFPFQLSLTSEILTKKIPMPEFNSQTHGVFNASGEYFLTIKNQSDIFINVKLPKLKSDAVHSAFLFKYHEGVKVSFKLIIKPPHYSELVIWFIVYITTLLTAVELLYTLLFTLKHNHMFVYCIMLSCNYCSYYPSDVITTNVIPKDSLPLCSVYALFGQMINFALYLYFASK